MTRPDTPALDGYAGLAEVDHSDLTPKMGYDTTGLIAELHREVQAQLANPTGSSVAVANLDVGHGDLANDDAAKQQIGAAADRLHSKAHGE